MGKSIGSWDSTKGFLCLVAIAYGSAVAGLILLFICPPVPKPTKETPEAAIERLEKKIDRIHNVIVGPQH
jgi:hypothetical protein